MSDAYGFLLKRFTKLSYPNSTATNPHAIDVHDEIVGGYTDASGIMHGFLRTDAAVWQSLDWQYPARGTALTGVNDNGDLVGYYIDQAGLQKPFDPFVGTRGKLDYIGTSMPSFASASAGCRGSR